MGDRKILKSFNWEKFLNKKDLNKLEKEGSNYSLYKGVKRFAKQFSPLEGFLGLKGRKKRTKEDAIEFMIQRGLVKTPQETEPFFNMLDEEWKGWTVCIPLKYGDIYLQRLIITKDSNCEGQTLYQTRVDKHYTLEYDGL